MKALLRSLHLCNLLDIPLTNELILVNSKIKNMKIMLSLMEKKTIVGVNGEPIVYYCIDNKCYFAYYQMQNSLVGSHGNGNLKFVDTNYKHEEMLEIWDDVTYEYFGMMRDQRVDFHNVEVDTMLSSSIWK